MTYGEIVRARIRERPLVSLLALIAIAIPLFYGCWLLWSVVGGGWALKNSAAAAQTAYRQSNADELQQAINDANTAMGRINSAVNSLPLKAVAAIPIAGTTVGDVQLFASAGAEMTQAGVAIAPNLDPNVYKDGAVNLASLDALLASLPQTEPNIAAAREDLKSVSASGPLAGPIGDAQRTALESLELASYAATQLAPNRAVVLDGFGAKSVQNYMVAFENPAQLRAPGGAPLSATIFSFNKGRMTTPFNGYIARYRPIPGRQQAFKTHELIVYDPASPLPWGEGAAGLAFVNSGAHPDWRLAGEDLTRAWNAAKEPKVDAMIGMDTHAIAALLAATGPVETEGYGTLTSENFAEKVVTDSYLDFEDNQRVRQSLNDQISATMIGRIQSGNFQTLATAFVALSAQAPGRHLQMKMQNSQLQTMVEDFGSGGVVYETAKSDTVGFFSRNRNMSKVDVYSEREMSVDVQLQTDGSAMVTQTLSVTNNAPDGLDSKAVIGYTTPLSVNEWFFYLPQGSVSPSLSVPAGYQQPTAHPDGLGRTVMRTEGKIEPKATVELKFSYKLPAGTFTATDGVIEYRNELNPQPVQNAPALTINVQAPDGQGCSGNGWSGGDEATWTGTQSIRQTLALTCD